MSQPPRRTPSAELLIDEALVRSLIEDQLPPADQSLPIIEFANGWDNSLWRLGADRILRLPRRRAAAELLVNERRWLPHLAPLLPVQTPMPLHRGAPAAGYPYQWSVVPWIEGDVACGVPLDQEQAVAFAEALRALHRTAPSEAPINEHRGVPLERRSPILERDLARLDGQFDTSALRRIFDAGAEAPSNDSRCWLHGDLHPKNVLTKNCRIVALIDWGDVCAGDPACDLASLWMLFPLETHKAFWDRYAFQGREEQQTALQQRARGWAVAFGCLLAALVDDDVLQSVGRTTLTRVLRE